MPPDNLAEAHRPRPTSVPPTASLLQRTAEDDFQANRYQVFDRLRPVRIDTNRIDVYHDAEEDGCYWVTTLDDGRMAVLTDDTEEHVSHIEGRWPFKVTFHDPDGVRIEIDDSIDDLVDRVVAWCCGVTSND